jgi:hypothetical protein
MSVDKRQQLIEKHILKLDPFEPQKLDEITNLISVAAQNTTFQPKYNSTKYLWLCCVKFIF